MVLHSELGIICVLIWTLPYGKLEVQHDCLCDQCWLVLQAEVFAFFFWTYCHLFETRAKLVFSLQCYSFAEFLGRFFPVCKKLLLHFASWASPFLAGLSREGKA